MFVMRLIGLSLLTLFCFAMGTIPSNQANGIAKLFGSLFFVAAPALYFLPAVEAALRKHQNLGSLLALNAFLGWTVLGWVGALIWALARPARVEATAPLQAERSPSPPAAAPPASVADDLLKLAQLLEKGLLTEEEFRQQKAAVLRRA
jgi:hypothetical protein